jgi:hypothetical protein
MECHPDSSRGASSPLPIVPLLLAALVVSGGCAYNLQEMDPGLHIGKRMTVSFRWEPWSEELYRLRLTGTIVGVDEEHLYLRAEEADNIGEWLDFLIGRSMVRFDAADRGLLVLNRDTIRSIEPVVPRDDPGQLMGLGASIYFDWSGYPSIMLVVGVDGVIQELDAEYLTIRDPKIFPEDFSIEGLVLHGKAVPHPDDESLLRVVRKEISIIRPDEPR